MPAENAKIPDWAQQERQTDFDWIQPNLGLFLFIATTAFDEHGRGAVTVDTTVQLPKIGHPMGYVTQEALAELEDEDINRLVRQYQPEREIVIVLWKEGDRTSTYRVAPKQES